MTPATVAGLGTVVSMAAGGDHSMVALSSGGTNFSNDVRTWGSDAFGQLGNGGANTNSSSPVAVSNPVDAGFNVTVTHVAAGGSHSLAGGTVELPSAGSPARPRIWGWGLNSEGQVGDGTQGDRIVPKTWDITGLAGNPIPDSWRVRQLSAGTNWSLALLADPANQNTRVFSWGQNNAGQLGYDTAGADQTQPREIIFTGLTTTIEQIAAGNEHGLALDADGFVWTWGSDSTQQLGNGAGAAHILPEKIAGLSDAVAIAAGGPFVSGHSGSSGNGNHDSDANAAGSHSAAVACDGGATQDSHVLTFLTANLTNLITIVDGPAGSCPAYPAPQAPFSSPGGSMAQYACPLKAPGGSGTYVRDPFDIALNTNISPHWNMYEEAKGGRLEARKILVIMTDGENNVYINSALANARTVAAANRTKRGDDLTDQEPCLQTTTPPCDDIEIYTVAFIDGPESNVEKTATQPALCGIGKTSLVADINPTAFDLMMTNASSSTPGKCDHYIPLAKTESLTVALEEIKDDILRGRLVN